MDYKPRILSGSIWDMTPPIHYMGIYGMQLPLCGIYNGSHYIPIYIYISSLSHCIPPHPPCLVKPLSRPVPSLRVAGDGQLGVEESDLAGKIGNGGPVDQWTVHMVHILWWFYGGFMGIYRGFSMANLWEFHQHWDYHRNRKVMVAVIIQWMTHKKPQGFRFSCFCWVE